MLKKYCVTYTLFVFQFKNYYSACFLNGAQLSRSNGFRGNRFFYFFPGSIIPQKHFTPDYHFCIT